ncbi:MAG: tetratricopeptide repeat protein [Candidatus Neomarinimicrobiota bacterium]
MKRIPSNLNRLRALAKRGTILFLQGIVMATMIWPVALVAQEIPWKPGRLISFWDRRVNVLEFRTPVRFLPFELKGGLLPYGGPGMFAGLPASFMQEDQTVFVLDSTESEVASIETFSSRLALVYDLNLAKLNLRNRFFPISLVDVMVGVALRTNQMPLATPLPANWPQARENYKVAPVFHHGLVTLNINYQRSERRYIYFQTSRGVATGSVYRAGLTGNYLKGSGTSADYALGIKFLGRGDREPRNAFGLELRYSLLDVPELNDPDRLSPIEGLQQRSFGLVFTYGPVFGGRATSADRAKHALYSGDYMAAEDGLREFIRDHPDHVRRRRAEKLLALAGELVPYQQVQLARALTDEGQLEEAMEWYDQAALRADSALVGAIDSGRAEIGYLFLQRADLLLQEGQLEQTSKLLQIALDLVPESEDLIVRYAAEVLIRQAHALRTRGDYVTALRYYDRAISADPARQVEIEGYKVRIAEDLLQQAHYAANRSALALALQSLQLGRELDPGRKTEMDSLIVRLEQRLAGITQVEIQQAMEEQMRSAREERGRMPPTRPRLGMLVAKIEDILGPPDHRTQSTDRLGVNHQLWEYTSGNFPGQYYFENYQLKRVELSPE